MRYEIKGGSFPIVVCQLESGEQKISADDSKVEVWVIPTNEELLIARDTVEIVNKAK